MPQRPPTSASSWLSGQRSGCSSPSKSRAAPFSAMLLVLSPIARIAATSAAERRISAGTAASSARADSIVRASRPALLDQGRRDALDRRVGEVPLAGEPHRGQLGALGEGPQLGELLQPALDPARRAEAAVVASGQFHAGTEI